MLRSAQQAAVTLQLLKKLDIKPQPMFQPQGVPIKPLTLFQKMGVGQLDLYILSPGRNSQEYETFMQNWPDGIISLSKSPSLPLTTLASVAVLLVWHPACPQEKVVRVLFPGVTPQAKLLQGLDKLKGLDFLQKPTVTTGDLERLGQDRNVKRTDSLESGKSLGKEGSPKYGKERIVREEGKEKGKILIGVAGKDLDKAKIKEMGLKHKTSFSEKNSSKKGVGKGGKKEKTVEKENSSKKTELIKRSGAPSKTKSENKTKPTKDTKNVSKTGEKKTQKLLGNEANSNKKVHVNTELPNNKSKPKTAEPEIPVKEKENQKQEIENQLGSKMSTPEDMTEDFFRLQQESEQEEAQVETADKEKQKSSELGHIKRFGDLSEEPFNKSVDRSEEEAAGGSGLTGVESGGSRAQHTPETGKKEEIDPKKNFPDESIKSSRPVKVVGFPCPLNKASKVECTDQLDITPTEYTLLDGALRNTPPSQASPENQALNSPDEETVEPVSPDSRPNSAGHTPYCLSPDDVWCNRTALSRLQAQMGNPDSADAYELTELSRQSEDQTKSAPENSTNSKEKHLSFLSLGAFKEGSSEPSPSVTTTTTHSLPAEVSSPQSTEVDESLSMSFEQGPTTVSQREGDNSVYHSHSNGGYFVGVPLPAKKPPRSLGQGSEIGRPFASKQFEASAHDVDLCLVSPCEFKHFKQPDSSSGTSDSSKGAFASNHHGNNNNCPKDQSHSESNAPACTEDCPSTTADGVLDSDSDESCSDPSNSPCDPKSSQALPPDPLPAPLRDSPPLPPHPDTSMPVPLMDSEAHGKRTKTSGSRDKKLSSVSSC